VAYNFVPKTAEEIGKAKIPNGAQLVKAYNFILKQDSRAKEPFAIDKTKPSDIKVLRGLKSSIDLTKIKELAPNFKFTWGNGSRGNSGVANRGIGFESDLVYDFNLYRSTGPGNDFASLSKNGNFVETFEKSYLMKWSDYEVKQMGELNQKRPLVFVGDQPMISPATGSNYDIGATVTDLTLLPKGNKSVSLGPVHVSAKFGKTVTFFGIGIKTILTPTEINQGYISNTKGQALLNMLGVDNIKFCQVFQQYGSGAGSEEEIDVTAKCDKAKLTNFLKGGIGHGYVLVHKIGNEVHHKMMTPTVLESAAKPTSVKVRYPFGSAKRVDIFVETSLFSLKMNIRSKDGDLYPTHIMADYVMKH